MANIILVEYLQDAKTLAETKRYKKRRIYTKHLSQIKELHTSPTNNEAEVYMLANKHTPASPLPSKKTETNSPKKRQQRRTAPRNHPAAATGTPQQQLGS